MAKREFIDRIHLLAEIKKLQKSPWYNLGKDNMVVSRALYNERKEAVEVVRDLCVNDESAITEQEIVKPYLEKLKAEIGKSKTEHEMQIAARDTKAKLLISHIYCDIVNILDKCKTESEG